jgi:hypothetical protein
MLEDKPDHPTEPTPSQQQSLIEILERADKLGGPVGEIIRAFARWIEGSRTWNWKNALLVFAFLTILYIGLVVLVWNGKIDSNTLAVAIGILIGVVVNFLKSIFPTRD